MASQTCNPWGIDVQWKMGYFIIKMKLVTSFNLSSTSGSAEKRKYLQARFPQLDANSFSSSRDTTFEQHILRVTNGKGEVQEIFFLFLSAKPHYAVVRSKDNMSH